MKNSEAGKIVALIAVNYPTPAWIDEEFSAFISLIMDLDFETTNAAALRWCRTKRERPTPADLRAFVVESQARSSGSPVLTTAEAWAFVVACFAKIGRYRAFPDTYPTVKRAVDTIGWETLCNSCDQMADRAHFFRVYESYSSREMEQRANTPGALPAPNPLLIK